MRPFHRSLAIVASLLLLCIGVTGTGIQLLDLSAILSGAAESDATIQSINEGKFGNGDHNAVTQSDFAAEALPAGLDVPQAFAVAQQGLAQAMPGKDPDFVELRMVGGKVIGQGRWGKEVKAVDAATGEPVAASSIKPFYPTRSLRQSFKEIHRMWGMSMPWRGDKPGVYIELVAGIAMCVLIYTGLTMYFRLLRQRRKIGKPNPLWLGGGLWRGLHRATSIGASVFLILVAASGTFIGFESTWHTFVPRPERVEPKPLPAAEVPAMVTATLAAMQAQEPGVPVRVIRMREFHGYKHGVVVTKEAVTRQIVFNTANGRQLNLTEPGYPESQFPLGMDVHEAAKHFHSGYMFGLPARVMSLIAGLALIYLSVSGIVLYFQMHRQRRQGGRGGLFWKG